MITIEDNDLPITVAQKIINGTKEIQSKAKVALNKALTGLDEDKCNKQDMFDIDEIKEIAEYLMVFYENNKDTDWGEIKCQEKT